MALALRDSFAASYDYDGSPAQPKDIDLLGFIRRDDPSGSCVHFARPYTLALRAHGITGAPASVRGMPRAAGLHTTLLSLLHHCICPFRISQT